MYSPLLVKPMRDELTAVGFEELMSADDVDRWVGNQEGTALLVINSVCGCAAGTARPGVRLALDNATKPDRLGTVFAGQEAEATAQARAAIPQVPPSSPSMALFKNGELVHFVPRHRIEGHSVEQVAANLVNAFEEHCA
ncbi:MAG: BrxA/BrxB family bacilliredoxin [Acidobacteriota bacterium]